MPALATSTSTGPSSASTAVNAASTAAASVMSHWTPNSAVGRAAAAVRHGHPVALLGERLRDRQADAPVAAGHQHGTGHTALLFARRFDAAWPLETRRYLRYADDTAQYGSRLRRGDGEPAEAGDPVGQAARTMTLAERCTAACRSV